MIQDVCADSGVNPGGKCDFELGADAICASHQNRLAPALAVKLKECAETANGRQDAATKSFPRHRGDSPFDAVGYRDIYSRIGIAHEMDLLPEGRGIDLENMKKALPAHFARMDDGVEVRLKTLADVARLPDFFRCIDGHVNHHRSANDIFARNEAPVAAVVRIVAAIAHHKIAAGGNHQLAVHEIPGHLRAPTGNVRKSQLGASLGEVFPRQAGGSGGGNSVGLLDSRSIHVNLSLDNLDVVAGQSDAALN